MGLLVKLAVAPDKRSRSNAFTLVELLVVVGIVATFTTIAYFSMSKLQTSTDSKTSVDRIVAMLRAQRMYAMLGNSNLRIKAMPQGIYFDQGTNEFVQFSCPQTMGCTYNPNTNNNIKGELEETLIFSDVNLTNGQVVFAPLSGDVLNYSQTRNSITISSTAEQRKTTITISSMGAIYTTKL